MVYREVPLSYDGGVRVRTTVQEGEVKKKWNSRGTLMIWGRFGMIGAPEDVLPTST